MTMRKMVNYLDIRLNPRRAFWAQIQHSTTKVANFNSLLSRLMANIGGPIQSRRGLMMPITDSVLLYFSEIWAEALKIDCRMRISSSVQRTTALRVASAYRTVLTGKREEESLRD